MRITLKVKCPKSRGSRKTCSWILLWIFGIFGYKIIEREHPSIFLSRLIVDCNRSLHRERAGGSKQYAQRRESMLLATTSRNIARSFHSNSRLYHRATSVGVSCSAKSKDSHTMKTASVSPTVIICPGNGCSQIRQSNWYGRLYDILTNDHKMNCICEDFPDPLHARRDIWVPHIR